jgi:hypothetical protein
MDGCQSSVHPNPHYTVLLNHQVIIYPHQLASNCRISITYRPLGGTDGGYYALESTHVCNTPFRLITGHALMRQ